ERGGALAAQVRLQVRHQQRSRDSLAGDVADHEPQPLLAEAQEIEIVAAHLARLHAAASVVQRARGRQALEEEASLDLPSDLELVIDATLSLELRRGGAPLLLDGAR